MTSGFAQQKNKDPRYKELSGQYGRSTEGICLFDDGTFLMYGYATAIFGSYGFEKDNVLFYPDKQELFTIYACRNKSIGDSTRMNFLGFERGGENFVKIGKDSIKRVFNKDANCFDAPFVYKTQNTPGKITLYNILEESSGEQVRNTWSYLINKGDNDFILIHNEPDQDYKNFGAVISGNEKGVTLKLSAFSSEQGIVKQRADKNQKQWQEVLQMKAEYDLSKKNKDVVFANKHYQSFPEPDNSYLYDAVSDQYSSKLASENEEYYRQNQYNDNRYLRKYVRLQPQRMDSSDMAKNEITASSIFFTVCGEGAEKSYHYDGFQKYKEQEEQPAPMPSTAVPVPPLPVKKKNNR